MATNYSLRGHEGKFRYATRKIARQKARLLMKNTRDNKHVSAYKCGVCDGYHIGHNNQYALSTLMDYIPDKQITFANYQKLA